MMNHNGSSERHNTSSYCPKDVSECRHILAERLQNMYRGQPLLIEGGMYKWMGKIAVVTDNKHPFSSPELQLQRLRARDSSSVEAASARIKAQLPTSEKLKYADIVVDNSGSPQDLQIQIDSLVRRLYKEVGWWRLCWLCPPIGLLSAAWTLLWRHVRRLRQSSRKR
ncbi:hypothetical protein BC629DRAFT_1636758, partial [Irpex lacteus]